MQYGYLDSTPPQVTRVVGGWTLGFGIALFFLTFKEFGSVHPPRGGIASVVLACLGAVLLVLGSRRLADADHANRQFFSENAGTEILASRRRLQVRLETARRWLIIMVVAWGACWVVFASGYSCEGDVCEGFVPHQEGLMEFFLGLFIVFGLATLVVATLTHFLGNETDRWEDLASDYLRRRDDGPTPGLKRSRWE
jgi:hypothetical protein